jgi:hypothetical protein
MKRSHYQTPRTMRDAWGEDTRLATEVVDTVYHWIAALGIGAFIGILIGLGM